MIHPTIPRGDKWLNHMKEVLRKGAKQRLEKKVNFIRDFPDGGSSF